jgi:hypothetical protein
MWQYAVDHMKKGKPIKDIEAIYGLQPDVKKQLMDIKK